jgi:hypothetical protein
MYENVINKAHYFAKIKNNMKNLKFVDKEMEL